jgi:hypothetical protein
MNIQNIVLIQPIYKKVVPDVAANSVHFVKIRCDLLKICSKALVCLFWDYFSSYFATIQEFVVLYYCFCITVTRVTCYVWFSVCRLTSTFSARTKSTQP